MSCEHATRSLPAPYGGWLRRSLPPRQWAALQAALATHRGFDPGSRDVARGVAAQLGTEALCAPASRLLVDANRSAHHRALLSEWSGQLSPLQRDQIVQRVWMPHRQLVMHAIAAAKAQFGSAHHVALHSFDPTLAPGRERIDIGLLYDPSRPLERILAKQMAIRLRARVPWLRLRNNAPYRGVADGLPTAMRKMHGPKTYAGIEIECNQALVHSDCWTQLRRAVAFAVAEALLLSTRPVGMRLHCPWG